MHWVHICSLNFKLLTALFSNCPYQICPSRSLYSPFPIILKDTTLKKKTCKQSHVSYTQTKVTCLRWNDPLSCLFNIDKSFKFAFKKALNKRSIIKTSLQMLKRNDNAWITFRKRGIIKNQVRNYSKLFERLPFLEWNIEFLNTFLRTKGCMGRKL